MNTNYRKEQYSLLIDNNNFLVRTNTYGNKTRCKWNVNWHSNAEYEIHIILQGKCKVGLNKKTEILEQDKCIIISPNCYHYSKTLTNSIEHFCINFQLEKGILNNYFSGVNDYLLFDINNAIRLACNEYQKECEYNKPLANDLKKAILTKLFIEILRINNIQVFFTNKRIETNNPIDIIDQFFDQYHSKNGLQDMLAEQLSISKRQLERYINKYYGKSFREKLIETKMEHAKWLLLESNLSILKISEIVGYSSETAFFNAFKRENKISPTKFRKLDKVKK